jgi:hypothetical protein
MAGALLTLAESSPALAAPTRAHPHPIQLSVGVENVADTGAYVAKLNVRPWAQVRVRLSYKNLSHSVQDTTIRVVLPKHVAVVGQPAITNALHPDGWLVATGLVIHQGKAFGRYAPDAAGYLTLTIQVPRTQLHCGSNWTSVHGIVTATHVGTATSSARLNIVRVCPTVSGTATAPS